MEVPILVVRLSFGDQRFQEVLEKVEALRDDPADTSSFTTEEKELSTKLYTVLATYLKGRCFNMVKAGMKAKNGFLLWRQLHKEFLPSTRQRSLALAQALSAYPTFPNKKSSLECVLAFEQMVQQFEESSMSNYPDELKAATLIRCCHAKVREYLQLTVTDSTTYGDIREAILSHDRASKVWSQETVLRSLTQGPTEQRTDGPIPMEVDRIYMEKGKGKEKGKFKGGKGKGGDWTSAWGFLRGKGRGRGFKGKGKTKASRRARKVSPKERIRAKESLGRIKAVRVYNMAIGQEIVQTRCVSTRSSRVSRFHNKLSSLVKEDKHNFLEANVDHAVLRQQAQAILQ